MELARQLTWSRPEPTARPYSDAEARRLPNFGAPPNRRDRRGVRYERAHPVRAAEVVNATTHTDFGTQCHTHYPPEPTALPVSGSKKYSRAGSTAKVTLRPARTATAAADRGSTRATPLGALPTR